MIFTLSKEQKSKAITNIKEILCSKADCNMNEIPSKQARMLSEDEQLVAILKGSSNIESISRGGGEESSSTTSSSSKAKATKSTSPSFVDLEIAEYILYIINNLPSKDPLLVWPRLVLRGLQMLPIIARRLFVISACSSYVERLFSKAGYWVTPRKNQLSSEMLNELLILNASYIYRASFLPRDVRDFLRAGKLKRFVKLHCKTPILVPANYADSDNDSSCDEGYL